MVWVVTSRLQKNDSDLKQACIFSLFPKKQELAKINRIAAEDIKKRRQEYTEDLYKKDIHDPDNHDCVISHLEPDILEYEVKWALGSITT